MTHHVPSLRRCLTSSVSLMALTFWAQAGHANPADGVVEAGTADITAPDPTTLLINQTSQKAIINWGNFDIGAGELTQFVLPNGSAVTLNRDFSGNPSEILGALKSNGHFYLINPNGILFGTGATVDVAGLVATTHNIRSDDFLNGKLDFNIAGDPSASVINQGNVTIDDMGIAAFVAPHVRNDGAIVARMGKVELASANGFTLDLYGDRLVSFLIENPNQTWYGADGQPVNALVENSGEIIADGGQVVLTAAAARGVVDSVINTDGIIQANSVAQQGGKIILGGGSAGTVKVAGKVSARGENAGETGGEIIVTGETLTAEQTAILDASGWSGGGKLLFGGDYLGGKATNEDVARFHFTMEDEPVATATAAFLMDGAQLKADALVAGDGGKVVVWSEDATVSAADISARGGSESGNGGFIETSGGYLQVEKAADASAINGAEGTWLLDPLDITIDRASNSNSLWWLNPNEAFNVYTGGGFTADAFRPTGTGSVLSAALIEFALNGGNNVVVTTFGTTGSGKGDIRLKTDITKRAGGNARLSLLADHDVTIDPGVDVRTVSGGLDFDVSAAFGSISGSGVGQIALNGGTMLMVARDGIRFSSAFDMPDNLAVFLNNLGSSSTLRRVDVAFAQDRLRFDYSSNAVELYSGAISLLDTSTTGNLLIGFAQRVNAHLYDRSIVSNSNRNWQLGPTVSASVVNSSALNGIPEIEGFTNPYWSFGAEPGAGYTPVIEVSVLRDGTADAGKHIVTAPSGYAALNAYLAGPQSVSPVQQVVQQATNPSVLFSAASSFGTLSNSVSTRPLPADPNLIYNQASGFGLWTGNSGQMSANALIGNLNPYIQAASAVYPNSSGPLKPALTFVQWANSVDMPSWQIALAKTIGFNASLYIINGQPILAYEGTSGGPLTLAGFVDWTTNIQNVIYGSPTTPANSLAFLMATSLKSQPQYSNLSLTGHSMGGGLAAYAGSISGTPAVTFNAAGVFNTPTAPFGASMILNLVIQGGGVSAGGLIGKTLTVKQNSVLASLPGVGLSYSHQMANFLGLTSTQLNFQMLGGSPVGFVAPIPPVNPAFQTANSTPPISSNAGVTLP